MNDVNISNFIKSIDVVTGTSQKTGREYKFIRITFINNFSIPVFLNNDQMFIINGMTEVNR